MECLYIEGMTTLIGNKVNIQFICYENFYYH
jgi:hypothetical protein